MINPINFKANVSGVGSVKVKEVSVPDNAAVTNPIVNENSFKGVEALANYNKVLLTAEPQEISAPAPAFKGDETKPEDNIEVPAK